MKGTNCSRHSVFAQANISNLPRSVEHHLHSAVGLVDLITQGTGKTAAEAHKREMLLVSFHRQPFRYEKHNTTFIDVLSMMQCFPVASETIILRIFSHESRDMITFSQSVIQFVLTLNEQQPCKTCQK